MTLAQTTLATGTPATAEPAPGTLVRLGRRALSDVGMTSAEYAVGTVAACGFGGLLYKVLTSDATLGLLTQVISKAFEWLF
jgi:hypothetical protein